MRTGAPQVVLHGGGVLVELPLLVQGPPPSRPPSASQLPPSRAGGAESARTVACRQHKCSRGSWAPRDKAGRGVGGACGPQRRRPVTRCARCAGG